MHARRSFGASAGQDSCVLALLALLAIQAVCVSLALGQTGQEASTLQAKPGTPASPSKPAPKPGEADPPSSDLPPTIVWPGQRVWLSDLPERNAQVGWGKFGKGGSLGFSDLKITFNGVPAPHGLGMHADARVDYDLAGKYRAFRATPAINDSAGWAGSEAPVVFRVLGDGQLRWESIGMHHSDTALECLVDISGVNVLTLTVSYDKRHAGEAMYGHAVWLEPFVTATEPPAALRLLLAGEKQERLRRQAELEADARAWLKEGKYDELEKLADEARRDRVILGGTPRLHWFYLIPCISRWPIFCNRAGVANLATSRRSRTPCNSVWAASWARGSTP
jgi:hypothetical protein